MLSDISCALVNTFSMLRIRSFTKELASDGIHPNNSLIASYLVTSWIAAALDIGICVTELYVEMPIWEG